jgi:hypothetical protein
LAKYSSHILELARKGAQHRLTELKAELADLMKAFPHLEYGSAISPGVPRQTYKPAPAKRRRRGMSAAARKAVSARMKKYWAARRAGRKK